MHEDLWAGVELKLQYAEFHLQQMSRSLQPPERTHMNVALEASGAIIGTDWQRSLYAHFDAFLSATRSVPWIIQCCFGEDRANRAMNEWLDERSPDEKARRREFQKQFKKDRDGFDGLLLSKARDISVHRTGFAPVTGKIKGFFGVVYDSNPVKSVPMSETRQIDDPNLAFLARPVPIRPLWSDFYIDGQPLFAACRDYLDGARTVMTEARKIFDQVHGSNSLSSPPP
jgi:hypothetical protein